MLADRRTLTKNSSWNFFVSNEGLIPEFLSKALKRDGLKIIPRMFIGNLAFEWNCDTKVNRQRKIPAWISVTVHLRSFARGVDHSNQRFIWFKACNFEFSFVNDSLV